LILCPLATALLGDARKEMLSELKS